MVSHFLDASTWVSLGTCHSMCPIVDSASAPTHVPPAGVPGLVNKTTTCTAIDGGTLVSLDSALLTPPLLLIGWSFANLPLCPPITEDCISWLCPLSIPSPVAIPVDFTPTGSCSRHHGLDLPSADNLVLHLTSTMTTSLTLSPNKCSDLKPQFQAIPVPIHYLLSSHLIFSFHGFDLNKTLEVSLQPFFL